MVIYKDEKITLRHGGVKAQYKVGRDIDLRYVEKQISKDDISWFDYLYRNNYLVSDKAVM